MKLHEIIKKRSELSSDFSKVKKEFTEAQATFNAEMQQLERLENIAMNDINVEYVQIAESVLRVGGDPYAITDDGSRYVIAKAAIDDIANGCSHLKSQYFGNKTYSGYYQRYDCKYGYGPSHGGISDRIGLTDEAQKRDLTDDEKDACIYYLKNYKKIKESEPAKKL